MGSLFWILSADINDLHMNSAMKSEEPLKGMVQGQDHQYWLIPELFCPVRRWNVHFTPWEMSQVLVRFRIRYGWPCLFLTKDNPLVNIGDSVCGITAKQKWFADGDGLDFISINQENKTQLTVYTHTVSKRILWGMEAWWSVWNDGLWKVWSVCWKL